MGKRQIGDLQPNELVVTLIISEIAAIPLQDTSQPILFGVLAIFMLVILEILMSVLSMKCQFIRQLMCGKSIVIIKNGEIDQKAMKSVRMTVLDLIEMLRQQEVFDLSTVAYAVLEVNGNLSVLLNSGDQPLTAKDMKIKKDKQHLSMAVITDGKINGKVLNELKVTKKDLEKILNKNTVTSDRVFLMTLDKTGDYEIIKKRDKS